MPQRTMVAFNGVEGVSRTQWAILTPKRCKTCQALSTVLSAQDGEWAMSIVPITLRVPQSPAVR
jgi:hypothetical protein